ncbi:hypothetical protein Vafri_5405, partial [Volvox africanus]
MSELRNCAACQTIPVKDAPAFATHASRTGSSRTRCGVVGPPATAAEGAVAFSATTPLCCSAFTAIPPDTDTLVPGSDATSSADAIDTASSSTSPTSAPPASSAAAALLSTVGTGNPLRAADAPLSADDTHASDDPTTVTPSTAGGASSSAASRSSSSSSTAPPSFSTLA